MSFPPKAIITTNNPLYQIIESGTNEAKIPFVLKFFKCTPTEIGFNIKSPRNTTARYNFNKEVILRNSADDGISITLLRLRLCYSQLHGA